MRTLLACLAGVFLVASVGRAQNPPSNSCAVASLPAIVQELDGQRMKQTVEKLVSFGTRNSLSDTTSPTRGIGAARRWLLEEMKRNAAASDGRMTADFQSSMQKSVRTNNQDTEMVNVVATIRGSGADANRYYIASGHYDSMNSNVMDAAGDAPGADDDASGTAVILELSRVLSRYPMMANVVLAALQGEEQGLLGAKGLSQYAVAQKWDVEGMMTNDIVGGVEGITGALDNHTLRVFSANGRGSGDSSSRNWARFVREQVRRYAPDIDAMLVYRGDRFGRGGDHLPFFEAGFPAVRFTEPEENYHHQHQNVRVENGVQYGDLPQHVSSDYLKLSATVNAIALVSAACAPPTPKDVKLTGFFQTGDTTITWTGPSDAAITGHEILIRDTRADEWQKIIPIGVERTYTLKRFLPDNVFIGVRAVGKDGSRSPVATPLER